MIISSSTTLILGFVICAVSSVFAQDSLKVATSQQKTEAIAARMKQELALTNDQTQRIAAIVLERFDALKQNTNDKATQLTDANAVAAKKIAGVLTAQQPAQYNEIKSETKRQKEEFLKQNPAYKFTEQEKEMDF
jgi:hypothetical protein